MPCYRPLYGWRSASVNESGKRSITFDRNSALVDQPVDVPCGKCVGCRLERSRQWAMRCMHEASLYEDNCFITLTYDDEHLPHDGSLDVGHWQKFMKRFRKAHGKMRYFHCGEYGAEESRPHYHACIFGFRPKDLVLWKKSNGIPLYTSASLESIWKKGYVTVGDVTFESAAYVARYTLKKLDNDAQDGVYCFGNPLNGEIYERAPEYTTMSRRPGIGSEFYKRHGREIHFNDSVIVNGREVKPPKYYDSLLQRADARALQDVKQNRICDAGRRSHDSTIARLRAREKCAEVRVGLLKRGMRDGP